MNIAALRLEVTDTRDEMQQIGTVFGDRANSI